MGKITKCPWGSFEVLSEAPDHKVKRIVVEPDGCLSLQLHHRRSEHWLVVAGLGMAIVDGKTKSLRAGSSLNIPQKVKHRVRNSSGENLIIIEVQTGEYCGDDDIERFEDKYGRV
jgi:mannose-1-phosphate guanylyltransferase/mannose-6-phosphate isomerase